MCLGAGAGEVPFKITAHWHAVRMDAQIDAPFSLVLFNNALSYYCTMLSYLAGEYI